MQIVNDSTSLLIAILPWALWCTWWLFGVNWSKAWPVLAEGGWVPALLLSIVASIAWSMIDARTCNCLGFMTLPNGWWQLGTLATLVALALTCGWLQGYFGWTPAEISLEPPATAHDHHHGHH